MRTISCSSRLACVCTRPANRVLRQFAFIATCCVLLAACVTNRPPKPATAWQQRQDELQRSHTWQLDGRAAVALGTQGWQASLNWRQTDLYAEVHLSGPFGIGAVILKQGPEGLSLNGAAPSDAVTSQVQDRLGFEPPLDHLRFWLLGVPDPAVAAEVKRNAQDRAQQLTQEGWSVLYDRYVAVGGDFLPAHVVLSRDDLHVKIVIDHWVWTQ
jgi:outer membrane lipoprotein LolB